LHRACLNWLIVGLRKVEVFFIKITSSAIRFIDWKRLKVKKGRSLVFYAYLSIPYEKKDHKFLSSIVVMYFVIIYNFKSKLISSIERREKTQILMWSISAYYFSWLPLNFHILIPYYLIKIAKKHYAFNLNDSAKLILMLDLKFRLIFH